MIRLSPRSGGLRRAAAAILGAAAFGCAPPGGVGGAGGLVDVTAAAPEAVIVEAAGRRVRVPAPEGRCVEEDRIGVQREAVVLMISDCADAGGPVAGVTIGAAPLFGDEAPAAALTALSTWARTPAGRRELGMGGEAGRVDVLEVDRRDGALFALIQDRGAEARPAPSTLFWRVFAEINGRMAMLSIYDLRAAGHDAAALRAIAETQLAALREANPGPAEGVAAAAAAAAAPPPRPAGG